MKLLHIAFTLTILGILIIILLTNILQPISLPLTNITSAQLNKQIKTQGIITNIQDYKNFQILTLQGENKSKINLFLSPPTNLTKNQEIIVIGILQQYKNQLQINVNQITTQKNKTTIQNQFLPKPKEQPK
jgi:hypothetical protein